MSIVFQLACFKTMCRYSQLLTYQSTVTVLHPFNFDEDVSV